MAITDSTHLKKEGTHTFLEYIIKHPNEQTSVTIQLANTEMHTIANEMKCLTDF